MFGPLGFPEIVLILVLALLLFGPRRMPHMIRSVGKVIGEVRRASNEFKRTIEQEMVDDELREAGRDLQATVADSRAILSGKVFLEDPPGLPDPPGKPTTVSPPDSDASSDSGDSGNSEDREDAKAGEADETAGSA